MEVKEFFKFAKEISKDVRPLNQVESKLVETILSKETIDYGKIKTYSPEDSKEIILLNLKENCLTLVKFLFQNGVRINTSVVNSCFKLISLEEKIKKNDPSSDLYAQIEKEKIIKSILNTIVDIVYLAEYKEEPLMEFLKTRRIPDELTVNLAISLDGETSFDSFELTVLAQKLMGPVLLSLVKSYKNLLRECAKIKLIECVKKLVYSKDKSVVFEIFYLLNEEKDLELLQIKPDGSEEYYGFISSLIMDKESAELAYKNLEDGFDDFETALKTLIGLSEAETRALQPKDKKIIIYLLECIKKIMKFKSIHFYKFISLFQQIIQLKVCREIKGLIYDILTHYVGERDIYVECVINCREEIDKEQKSRDYFLLPRVIKFINAYIERENLENRLIQMGQSTGSPYTQGSIESVCLNELGSPDWRAIGLSSGDPETIIQCLGLYMDPEFIKLNASHIRTAMIRDTRVIDSLIQFQVEHKVVIDDISLINIILCHSTPMFFKYASLFTDFSFYLNGDFLERFSENINEAIDWLNEKYTRETGVFILRNSAYFNEILSNKHEIQSKITPIYERILDENINEVSFRLFNKEDPVESNYMFYLHDDPDYYCEEYFRIFSKILLYKKFYTNEEITSEIIIPKSVSTSYEIYVKAKIVCGLDVTADIDFLRRNQLATHDFLGFAKICQVYTNTPVMSPSILLNFGIKDTNYVLKHFESSSEMEKIILFFSIGEMLKDMESLIKKEVLNNMKCRNPIYLKMCILQLFKCKDLDQIILILDKQYDDKELIFNLSLHNIMTGGKYFYPKIFESGSEEAKCDALLLIKYLNIWPKETVQRVAEEMNNSFSGSIKYLLEDSSA